MGQKFRGLENGSFGGGYFGEGGEGTRMRTWTLGYRSDSMVCVFELVG